MDFCFPGPGFRSGERKKHKKKTINAMMKASKNREGNERGSGSRAVPRLWRQPAFGTQLQVSGKQRHRLGTKRVCGPASSSSHQQKGPRRYCNRWAGAATRTKNGPEGGLASGRPGRVRKLCRHADRKYKTARGVQERLGQARGVRMPKGRRKK